MNANVMAVRSNEANGEKLTMVKRYADSVATIIEKYLQMAGMHQPDHDPESSTRLLENLAIREAKEFVTLAVALGAMGAAAADKFMEMINSLRYPGFNLGEDYEIGFEFALGSVIRDILEKFRKYFKEGRR